MKVETKIYYPSIAAVEAAARKLQDVAAVTPLIANQRYSKKFEANIVFKREDLQQVRSYKIRGAYNKMSSLSPTQVENGIVCASAGNHAQGVALSCRLLKIKGTIFMPSPTPQQKIEQVKMFGEEYTIMYLCQLAAADYQPGYLQSLNNCLPIQKLLAWNRKVLRPC